MPSRLLAPCRALLLGLLPLAGTAQGLDYNIDEVRAHGAWHSLRLSLGEERHARALEASSYADSTLSVNATPGACDRPWLELRVALAEVQADSATVNRVPVDLLVDQGAVHTGEGAFLIERGDDGFYVRLSRLDTVALLDAMAAGETLRLRIHRAPEDYWFMAFDLTGFEAARARMARLCRNADETP
ncbi:hypothetical protein [Halomonas koreensis]|uniref:Uncharacterized protein n=1 Tax=Halomonas koreensis TaxID=245385 RepID=A0ABU1G1U7_9GAMM|nr:hypothetical protein [Halomonas koreensis]MDR5866885.1 hypothetical protein [Halomonas koreensis]